jgi:hypothetical protein
MATEKMLCESPSGEVCSSNLDRPTLFWRGLLSQLPSDPIALTWCNMTDYTGRAVGETGGIAARSSQNIPIIADPWVSDRARKTLDEVVMAVFPHM